MKCPSCGKENINGAKVCVQCGGELTVHGRMDETLSFKIGEQIEEEKSFDLSELVAEHPVLVIVRGRNIGESFLLEDNEVSIGRDPQSDIFLDDITVSRKHARIRIDGEKTIISDVGSLNGTYVNRNQIEEIDLRDRDEVQIGKFRLVFLMKIR